MNKSRRESGRETLFRLHFPSAVYCDSGRQQRWAARERADRGDDRRTGKQRDERRSAAFRRSSSRPLTLSSTGVEKSPTELTVKKGKRRNREIEKQR